MEGHEVVLIYVIGLNAATTHLNDYVRVIGMLVRTREVCSEGWLDVAEGFGTIIG